MSDLSEGEQAWLEANVKRPRTYSLYCGECRRLLDVPEANLPDGEVWVCDSCKGADA